MELRVTIELLDEEGNVLADSALLSDVTPSDDGFDVPELDDGFQGDVEQELEDIVTEWFEQYG